MDKKQLTKNPLLRARPDAISPSGGSTVPASLPSGVIPVATSVVEPSRTGCRFDEGGLCMCMCVLVCPCVTVGTCVCVCLCLCWWGGAVAVEAMGSVGASCPSIFDEI